MANLTHHWKVWLKPNRFTADDEMDFVAITLAADKTLRNEDFARLIVEGRSEIQYETILSILNQRDSIILTKLAECFPVQDGVVHMHPSVPGVWHGANAKFDPAVHGPRITVSETAETREALSHIGVTVLGVKGDGAFIATVTDVSTGLMNDTITIGEDIIIEGEKIKIAPEGEVGLGIFLQNLASDEIFQTTTHYSMNTPKKIIVRVPVVTPGLYRLFEVTRYVQGDRYLNDQRTITYDSYLTAHV
jgi:hypothetical protein